MAIWADVCVYGGTAGGYGHFVKKSLMLGYVHPGPPVGTPGSRCGSAAAHSPRSLDEH